MKLPKLQSEHNLHPELEQSFHQATRRFHFHRDALSELPMSDQILFEQFGQGPYATPEFSCLHTAIEAQALQRPEAIAAIHEGQEVTYQALNEKANQLAQFLSQRGVGQGDAVGIFLTRSIPMLIGILATLKLGACYVPQHAGVAPEKVLKHVCDTANIDVVLSLSHLSEHLPEFEHQKLFFLDELLDELSPANQYSFPLVDPTSRCFILFTSGTTGTPNGVQVTHQNVANIVMTSPGNLGIEPGMKVGQILSIAFDMCAWEIFVTLCHGATLLIRSRNIEETVSRADAVIATPSILASLSAERCQSVQVAAVAGEPCPQPLADSWSSFCRFYNSCGPTETTIINTAQHYSESCDELTIGKPTPNNTVYVLDEDLKPCAIGEVGEMWAGGLCVTSGYIGNEVLNADRYRPDPFLGGKYKMFRTRDLGKWNKNGELIHLGRTDDQVKILGFRVELDSVSRVLEKTDHCHQAVTMKVDCKTLIAFVTPSHVNPEQAQESVRAHLPYYCVPKVVFALDNLPKTPRGKIDKRALMAHFQESQTEVTEETQ
ncbi:putative ANTIBIOTIC SYNTHETASE [Vibrio nigripulchritudo SFn27]|uniref:Putative ANTIBIOTIC SYNTHETASE n=1 Tax=Vibrio nigripulchritudo TaxID=28173 RepID=U4K8J1_9VIBR|nr:AMP-binding protein [Vibrio nigripulchritudo]CCN84819.1 putative ANTIBIOTIC SYNTHETASE [Vibrio nigripulchritudo BLFn1]CCN87688.1 putative ANTIBIOTIC SYNTHETASE [Vibrio nigripulchritudo SFn27]CCN95816.1 putative ANTIBIOTIC SYNTHETASE [Vibrio nigripulchritudo ENn2]CCO38974.1 putative ANTIBIOTIC SYNTHETASE [Vibrio nigripulchritudo SFn135]CCO51933.1 putative ANTIBIOTIC SYNTHETASE [Vibrio nigripulchritudo Wn13]